MTEYETMTYERKGKIGYIMFNRPRSLNSVNSQVEIDLTDAFLEFDSDEEAWVCILYGTGRCFCAGADIKSQFVSMTPLQAAAASRGRSAERYLGRSINWKPVIAAVHGYALGAGISIAIECDLIVALEEAMFGITETKRGVYGGGVWAKMNAFMPSKVLTEMAITGEPVGAPEMYRLGFINRLVPTGKHFEAAEELAEKVLKTPPLACRAGVRLSRRQWVQPVADADMYGQPLRLHLSEDFKESSKSFVEKRVPIYHAR